MTEAPIESTGLQASYELKYELDGTSFAVRQNLADILRRELLGPIHGSKEILPFSPRSQYFVGHIAPVKLVGSTTALAPSQNPIANAYADRLWPFYERRRRLTLKMIVEQHYSRVLVNRHI